MVELPKIGDRISAEKFHVSKFNVRYGQPFGESEEDKELISQLRFGKVVQPFKARIEDDGYGVYVGRRRFLGKKAFTTHFVVGKDCIVVDVNPEAAREESLIENIQALQKDMDPITRAENISDIISKGGGGLRSTARRLGLKASTLSDWLRALELSPNMQKAVRNGLVTWSVARQLARMKLTQEKQDELAEILETEGLAAFNREVARIPTGKKKRGIPKGQYIILRATFHNSWKPDMELYEKLEKLAKEKDMKIDDYVKWALEEFVKSL